MNEAQTRAELIDPKLIASGWGVAEGSKILRKNTHSLRPGKRRQDPLPFTPENFYYAHLDWGRLP